MEGPLEESLARVKVPMRVPTAVGAKITETWQLAPMARVAVQVLAVCEKSPDWVIPEMFRLAVPLLVMVMDCAALESPVVTAEKVRLAGEITAREYSAGVPTEVRSVVQPVRPKRHPTRPRLPINERLRSTRTGGRSKRAPQKSDSRFSVCDRASSARPGRCEKGSSSNPEKVVAVQHPAAASYQWFQPSEVSGSDVRDSD